MVSSQAQWQHGKKPSDLPGSRCKRTAKPVQGKNRKAPLAHRVGIILSIGRRKIGRSKVDHAKEQAIIRNCEIFSGFPYMC